MPTSNTDAESNYNVAHLMLMQGNYADAELYIQKALESDRQYGEAWLLLGNIFGLTNQHQLSEEAFRRSYTLLTGNPDAAFGLAHILRARGKSGEAAPFFEEALKRYKTLTMNDPGNVNAHRALSELYFMQNDFASSEAELKAALAYAPNDLDLLLKLADVLSFQSKGKEMQITSENALRQNPGSLEAHLKLADALNLMGEPDKALMHVNHVLSKDSKHVRAISLSAMLYEKLGEFEKGFRQLKPLIESGSLENINTLFAFAKLAKHTGQYEEAIALLEDSLKKNSLSNDSVRQMVHFSLGDLYDLSGSYDEAFSHYHNANNLKSAAYNREQYDKYFSDLILTFDRNALMELPSSDNHSDLPVFIVGMPRSGTTLAEQILASHPQVHPAGELGHITMFSRSLKLITGSGWTYPSCMRSITKGIVTGASSEYMDILRCLGKSAVRVTDKFPTNFLHLGLIQLLFPGSRIIHCQRNPLDTCLSCYFQHFLGPHDYAYDLVTLGHFYANYLRLMEHWRNVLDIPLFELQYESLVSNQENKSRELVQYCGLDWNHACLEFHDHKRFAPTASYDQVRRPIYKSSLGRWKNYEKHLQPLLDNLEPAI